MPANTGDGRYLGGWRGRGRGLKTSTLQKRVAFGSASQTAKSVWSDWYFAAAAGGSITGTLSVTESGSDTIASDGVVIYDNTDTSLGLSPVTVTTFQACSDVLTVRTGAGGQLFLSGSVEYSTDETTTGTYSAEGLWKYRTVGGSWVDGPTGTSIGACLVILGAVDSTGLIDAAGTISSLSPNTNYEVQFYLRRVSSPVAASIDPVGLVEVTSLSGTITGTLSVTESGADTCVSTGDVIVQGTLAATEIGSDTVVSTGDVIVQGALSATESGSDTVVATGDVIVQGALAATETGSDTVVASGTVTASTITGSISATEVGSDTVVSTGTVLVQGNVSATETGSDTVTASGKVQIQGAVSATEVGSDTVVATGTGSNASVVGDIAAQETSTDTCFAYGFTLDPEPVIEYDIRLFDSMRSSGNLRGAYKSVRGLEHMMWDRVLQKCAYNPNVYVTADDPNTWRIGYGRPVTEALQQKRQNLEKSEKTSGYVLS